MNNPQDFKILQTYKESLEFGEKILSYPRIMKVLFRNILPQFISSPVFKPFEDPFYALDGKFATIEDMKFLKKCASLQKEGIENILKAISQKEPIVWVEWALTHELLKGFDVTAICPETLCIYANDVSKEASAEVFKAAEDRGFSSEGCSSQKGALGALFLKEIPNPKAIVAATHPCDSGVSIYQTLEYFTKSPAFILNTPYWRDKESIKSYVLNLKELISFLEKTLNQKFNIDRFREAILETNKINDLLTEISQMGRAIPCPYSLNRLNKLWLLAAQYPWSSKNN